MRVALDAGPLLDPPTGVGRYTAELARSLDAMGATVCKFAFAMGGKAATDIARFRIPARLARVMWRWTGAPTATRLVGGADVVHGTNFVLPALGPAAGVVTIHDLSYLQEGAFPGADRLRKLVPWSIERAGRVIVPTEAIAIEVTKHYGTAREKLVVTHEGVSPLFFGATPLSDSALAGMGIARPFVLATGTDAPRKNLQRLLDAWLAAEMGRSGWTLVLAGPRGWGPRFGRTDDIHPLGWIGDETLPGLMAAADVFCYPSLYEGFGLPPLEAMAAGTACLVGEYSAAREVLGEGAFLVDPLSTESVADGLRRLVDDSQLRRTFSVRGRAQASLYTWEKTARATLGAYAAAIDAHKASAAQ
ncbi:MAG TPA: glycosyltransferase family 1 protein [Actinomycetota bacterium]|nr:glycosyltransferase family 1 protein [Actinomycetota bacterium]